MGDRSSQLWPVPMAYGPVEVTVTPPGSRAITHRALILASLATSPSRIRRHRQARDARVLATALRALGATIDELDEEWRITPATFDGPGHIECDADAAIVDLVAPTAALATGDVSFDGDPHTPVAASTMAALRAVGVAADDASGGYGRLPIVVHGSGSVPGGHVALDMAASPQLASGLLLAGACYVHGVTVEHRGRRVGSIPDVEMTVAMLRERGVRVDHVTPTSWRVHPGPVDGLDMVVDPDLYDAVPFLAAAMVTGGRAWVPDWPLSTTQPSEQLRDLLTRMGATCVLDDGLTVTGTGRIHGIDVDLRGVTELTPVVAALAAQADETSHLHGIAHLREREIDWLAAVAGQINTLGGDVTQTEDGLTVRPRQLDGGVAHTHGNYRMAQAAAVLGLTVAGIQVNDLTATDTAMHEFTRAWTAMLRLERAA